MRKFISLFVFSAGFALASPSPSRALDGIWDATIAAGNSPIPFRIGFSGSGASVHGWFFNGDEKEESSSGSFDGQNLTLNFASYASVLRATVRDGVLDGEYVQRGRKSAVHAVPESAEASASENAPDIAGIWYLENVNSSKKGEEAWSFVVRQDGPRASAAILRIDGDTGTLTGGFRDGRFVLSHFSGARPSQIVVTPREDGTLTVELSGQHHEGVITGYRPEVAEAKGLPRPLDAGLHTSVKDPSKPFEFRFPDLNGNEISNTDARFAGKAVLINITGSWCPNCHDEAPFLESLHRKYHDQGLEIVAISFEEAEQLTSPERLRAFIAQYGIGYTVLLGGETSTAKDRLASAKDWDCWPTTFFVGRDGLVKGTHAGFAGPGSGELYTKATEEFEARVKRLLAGDEASSR